MHNFENRCQQMNLENLGNGCFHYRDIHSEIVYRYLTTHGGTGHADEATLPHLGIFSRQTEDDEYTFCGVVSDLYQFVGNEVINQSLRDSIQGNNTTIFHEKRNFNDVRTVMINEIVIQNPKTVSNVGNIYPTAIASNSYDGTRSARISFGLYLQDRNIHFGFHQKIAQMKKVHIVTSRSTLSSVVEGYVNAFSQSIDEMINDSFNVTLSEEDVLRTLDLVEEVGKKRREKISEFLQQTLEGSDQGSIPAWKMFLAITEYSTKEENLNAKKLLENAAERVLIVPERMINAIQPPQQSS